MKIYDHKSSLIYQNEKNCAGEMVYLKKIKWGCEVRFNSIFSIQINFAIKKYSNQLCKTKLFLIIELK
ncbi:hypothetical protein BpHYR1_008843 [Brachionus plicatilis]|uniref:Uncharacterized protein n=1 Tax=Brachionus plicatilis TaxID=10195 RepID=A0A3M7T5H4_BRAPC|nr:hypothetical protein BpHYR1_008843 [Brachionus plicatilis]